MDKYIVNLISNNSRVVIPDFGAFIVKQVNPKKIVFNEFLRYNDGLLIDYVTKTEDIEKEKVTSRLDAFVKKSFEVLDNGEKLTIEGLGTLQKDSLGKIEFEQFAGNINLKAEKTTVIERKSEPKSEPKSAPKPEPKIESRPEPKSEKKEEKKISSAEPKKEEKPVEKTSADKGKTEVLKEFNSKEPEDKKEDVKKESRDSSKSPVPPSPLSNKKDETKLESKKPIESKTEEKKSPVEPIKDKPAAEKPKEHTAPAASSEKPAEDKNKMVYDMHSIGKRPRIMSQKSSSKAGLWIVVALLIGVIIVFFYLVNNQRNVLKGGQDEVKIITETRTEDSDMDVTGESDQIAEEEQTKAVETEPRNNFVEKREEQPVVKKETSAPADKPALSSSKKYYIVAGSFKNEKNADKYVLVLKNNGYPAEKFGMINGMHLVSFHSFSNRIQAVKELENIRDDFEPKAWMIKY